MSSLYNIDLIIEERDYFLASENIDISQTIIDKINEINIEFKIIK